MAVTRCRKCNCSFLGSTEFTCQDGEGHDFPGIDDTDYNDRPAARALQVCLSILTPAEAWQAMTPEQRLAMAKAAPRITGPWKMSDYPTFVGGAGEVPCWERGYLGRHAAIVLTSRYCAGALRKDVGTFPTLEGAQAACDAALIAAGWVLED